MTDYRIRHVKCDETKPTCRKCAKSDWKCDGYAETPAAKGSKAAQKQLVPKPGRSTSSASASPSPASSVVNLLPTNSRFQNDREYRYFKIFCDETAVQLSGFFDSTLWEDLILKACEIEPPIRHAAIAIGAINFHSNEESISEAQMRRELAFREYSIAISQIWHSISKGTHDLRVTLMACLLFACFELFTDYPESAAGQISAGIRMIEDWYRHPDHPVIDPSCITSPNPWVVEDEILQAFGRLELQTTSYADSRAARVHIAHHRCGNLPFEVIPMVFSNLKEARIYLDVIMRQTMHYEASLENPAEYEGLALQNENFFSPFQNSHDQYEKIMESYQHWLEAFTPVWETAHSPEGGHLLLGAASLRLTFLSSHLSHATLSGDPAIHDGRFDDELSQIITLANIIIANSPIPNRPETCISLEGRLSIPLTTVILRYRNRRLRSGALDILAQQPRREGVWNTQLLGKCLEWINGLEEDGLDADLEVVPENRITRDFSWHFNPETRSIDLRAMVPSLDIPGHFTEQQGSVPRPSSNSPGRPDSWQTGRHNFEFESWANGHFS